MNVPPSSRAYRRIYTKIMCLCCFSVSGCAHLYSNSSIKTVDCSEIHDIVNFSELQIKKKLDQQDISNIKRIIVDYVHGGMINEVGEEEIGLICVYRAPEPSMTIYFFAPHLTADREFIYMTRENSIQYRSFIELSFCRTCNFIEWPEDEVGADVEVMLQKQLKREVQDLKQRYYGLDRDSRLRIALESVDEYVLSIMVSDVDPAVRMIAVTNSHVDPRDVERLAMTDTDYKVREAAYRVMERCLDEKAANKLRQRWYTGEKRLHGPVLFE